MPSSKKRMMNLDLRGSVFNDFSIYQNDSGNGGNASYTDISSTGSGHSAIPSYLLKNVYKGETAGGPFHFSLLQLSESGIELQVFTEALRFVLYSSEYPSFVSQLDNSDAQVFVDILDRALDTVQHDSDLQQKCLRALRKLCGQFRLLPTSYELSGGLDKISDQALAAGGYGDVWRGTYKNSSVAIKILRVYQTDNMELLRKKFCKEVLIWKRLQHPNIVPCLGVSNKFPMSMISEWMFQGNVTNYVRSHPNVIRGQLVIDVATGLQHLHDFNIVHGDLKGGNILVNGQGQACLTDFGMTSIIGDPATYNATTKQISFGTTRWMAPELLDYEGIGTENTRPSKAGDIYAFAMATYEIFTGAIPFSRLNDTAVIFTVSKGNRPSKPAHALELGLTDGIWEVVELCWQQDRDRRPTIHLVLANLMGRPS